MSCRLSRHLIEKLRKRAIPQTLIEQVLRAPEQKVPEVDNITCYQSRVDVGGKAYLLRVMVNETAQPPVAVTAYLTSKANKYWRQP